MKIVIRKEFDGKYYIGYCENLPNCYVQTEVSDELVVRLRRAIEIYRKNCELRNQSLPNEPDRPVINKQIRFDTIHADQLVKILQRMHYHVEYVNHESTLLINSNFPFNRIHLPQNTSVSPIIIARLFGKKNTIWVGRRHLNISSTG